MSAPTRRWFAYFIFGLALGSSSAVAAATNATTFTPRDFTLQAPALARTSSTVLLLWEPPLPDGERAARYEILSDGIAVGTTKKLSFTAAQLSPGRTYRFSVRALDASGHPMAESLGIDAAAKPPSTIFNVRDRDARGDGQHDDTAAIQATIDACTQDGIVFVPPGSYLVNHLQLKGHLTLHLAAGAILRLVGREASQPVRGKIETQGDGGPVNVGYGALITAVHADNLTITGEGVIDGNGPTWWQHLQEYRPRLLQIIASRSVFVQGITLQDPPQFNTLLSYVDDATFSGVTFLKRTAQPSANGDALDPDSSRNILIVGCNFGNQDDSISIKAGLAAESATVRPRSSEHIVVRDCRFDGTLAPGSHPLGIAIGSGASGGVRHVLVKNCEFVNAASLANIRINRSSRYGRVEDVCFENCTYTNARFPDEPWNRAPISLDLFYYAQTGDNPDAGQPLTPGTPFFRDIRFRNITIDNPRGRAIYLSGLAEKPLQDITFTHVRAESKTGLFARNVQGLVLEDVMIKPKAGPPYEWGLNVTHHP